MQMAGNPETNVPRELRYFEGEQAAKQRVAGKLSRQAGGPGQEEAMAG